MSAAAGEPSGSAERGGPSTAGADETVVERRRSLVFRLSRDPLAATAAALLIAVVLASVFAGFLAPYDPIDQDLDIILAGPSGDHWLGTDELGRDLLSRVLFAGRISLLAALQAVVVASVVGIPLGVLAGYRGGIVDAVVSRTTDALISFPPLVLAVAIVAALGPSLRNAMIAVGVVFAPRFIRVTRGVTLSVREETYIESSRALGSSPFRIMWRHVLPNIASPLVVQVTLTMALAVLAEAALSFLGLGATLPDASWGTLLQRAARRMEQAPLYAISPGVMIAGVVLALNMFGDSLRDMIAGGERAQD